MVMCIKMVSSTETRDVSTSHAASATVRQLVALVFERALAEAEGTIYILTTSVARRLSSCLKKNMLMHILRDIYEDTYIILIKMLNNISMHVIVCKWGCVGWCLCLCVV